MSRANSEMILADLTPLSMLRQSWPSWRFWAATPPRSATFLPDGSSVAAFSIWRPITFHGDSAPSS